MSNIKGFEWIGFGKKSFFDVMDFLSSSVLLPLGGFAMAFFIGFVLNKDKIYYFAKDRGMKSKLVFNFWYYSVKIIGSLALIVIMLNMLGVLKI